MAAGDRIDAATERVNEMIVTRPRAVVLAFLVLTAVFLGGVGLLSTETDATGSFTESRPEQAALETINEEFDPPFETAAESTQLIQRGDDVLTKQALVRSLTVLERVEANERLRMDGASGPAPRIARTLDPSATTTAEQRRVIEAASPSRLRRTIRSLGDDPAFTGSLSTDFNPAEAAASASITVISHDVPAAAGDDELAEIQTGVRTVATAVPGDLRAFGSGIVETEMGSVIGDSLTIVMPVVVLLLLGFLVVAYRDPIDLVLGLLALVMTIIWTFGFLGYAGIPFNQQMISVPVLLLAVGVDFGIHIINRFREERVRGFEPVEAMRTANNQLMVAFVLVTVTTVFGFGANVVSDLGPIRDMGIAASVGIVFTFLLFGLFLPAAKLAMDRLRDRLGVPAFNTKPIASEESRLGQVLTIPARASRHAPVVLIVVLLCSGGLVGLYGTGVATSFDTEDFLPPEDQPGYVEVLPESLAPGEYTVTETQNLLEDNFETSQGQSVKLYVEGQFEANHALEALADPDDDPPDSLAVGAGGSAESQSIVTVIQSQAQRDPEFGALVARNDRNGDDIPERNLGQIYDALFASPAGDRASQYLTPDRRRAQIEYSVASDASQTEVAADATAHAATFRQETIATGQMVVFAAVSDLIFASAIEGLALALVLTGLFLVVAYAAVEGNPWLGVVNVFPILIAIAFLVGTMRWLAMPLNGLTATILSISIGLGIAYSVHTTHRFVDEYGDGVGASQALLTTLSGTGGALVGSMLTTSLGTGALALAITPVLGDFGLLMALSVFYSFVMSIVALPPAMLVWARYTGSETVEEHPVAA